MQQITQENTLEMILKSFEENCEKLSLIHKSKVFYEYFKERDDNNEPTGKVFVAYIKQPHILTAAKCLDMIMAKRLYEAGNLVWESMILESETDSEIKNNDKYRLGLQGRLGMLLQLQSPEDKKK